MAQVEGKTIDMVHHADRQPQKTEEEACGDHSGPSFGQHMPLEQDPHYTEVRDYPLLDVHQPAVSDNRFHC
jgi:hypothetical protein